MAELPFPEPPLRDAELALRAWTGADVPAIAAACQDPEIPRWTHVPSPYGEADAHRFVLESEQGRRKGQRLALAIAGAGGLIGSIEVELGAEPGVAEIGYWIVAEVRRRGAATRSVRLLSRWAFDRLGMERLELLAHPLNEASARVALGAGYTREGLLRGYRARKGAREDLVMFSLLRTDLEPA